MWAKVHIEYGSLMKVEFQVVGEGKFNTMILACTLRLGNDYHYTKQFIDKIHPTSYGEKLLRRVGVTAK